MRDMASERRQIFIREVPRVIPNHQRTVNLAGTPLRIAGGAGIASVDRESRLLFVLNNDLALNTELSLGHLPGRQAGAKYERLIVLPDLTVIVIGHDRVVCVDRSGRQRWSLTFPSWPMGMVGGDAVLINHHLAIVVPERAAPTGYSQVPKAQLAVVDIGDGSESGRIELLDEIGYPQGFHALTRRGGDGGVLGGGYGQDGAQIWRIAAGAGRVEATALGTLDRILGDLSPNGNELLTTPHDDGALILYGWGNLTEAGRLQRASVFVLEQGDDDYTADGFDYYAWFLSNDRLLALTRQGRLLVIDRHQMALEYLLVPDGFDIIGYDNRGQPVNDAAEALDFEGEITGVTVMTRTESCYTARAGVSSSANCRGSSRGAGSGRGRKASHRRRAVHS